MRERNDDCPALELVAAAYKLDHKHDYEKAARKSGITGENLLSILEARLDNVVTRLGFAA